MKKWTIWLLVIVMALTFGSLIYIQILYMESIVRMRNNQFNESVMRSLYSTASYLEREETKRFLIDDVGAMESTVFGAESEIDLDSKMLQPPVPMLSDSLNISLSPQKEITLSDEQLTLRERYRSLRDRIRGQYLYQRGLLNEVILTILRESGNRRVEERADSVTIRDYLMTELANNGVTIPFEFAVTNDKGGRMYATEKFVGEDDGDIYTQVLFGNSNCRLNLVVEFPQRSIYVKGILKFFIPTLAFTLILLIVFIYTITLAFRQKRLTEMKTDFINNMTHELKTPISTISLASQMLEDESVQKSPSMLQHLSGVIGDETKRLRFQVEKVLQMSMFDNQQPNLKLTDVNVNDVISQVVNTFRLKVERYGGKIDVELNATDPMVLVDNMHLTNVLFNLMDNAVKYREEERPLQLTVRSWNINRKLCISIADNGIGIKREDLKRIFDKFYRVSTGNRHDVKGFGLGLAYVKKMVMEFGGTITAESEPDKGTKFTITLPTLKSGTEN